MTIPELSDTLLPSRSSLFLRGIASELAAAAQPIYDAWDQDADGMDQVYGGGGICQDIASALVETLDANGIEAVTVFSSIGDNHVFVAAALSDGVWMVDIPASAYESGGGYSWVKKPDVVFEADHISLLRIDAAVINGDELAERYAD